MNPIQIILSPAGEELVVLPKADYDALVAAVEELDEDAADIAAYDEAKAALATGRDVALPPEVSRLILRGNTRLKALRLWRGVSQLKVAHIAGVGQGYLSDLENGKKAGAPETLASLAKALDIPAWWIT